jgi:hypothetical protein
MDEIFKTKVIIIGGYAIGTRDKGSGRMCRRHPCGRRQFEDLKI